MILSERRRRKFIGAMAAICYNAAMSRLWEKIRSAVANDRFLVSWHADERFEEREITDWQVITGIEEAEIVRERPSSKPNPSVVIRQWLEDGTEIEVIRSWLEDSQRAKLVTVYFSD